MGPALRTRLLRAAAIVASIACFLVGAPCVWFSLLGFTDQAGDIGRGESLELGWTMLGLGAIPVALGITLLVGGLRRDRARCEVWAGAGHAAAAPSATAPKRRRRRGELGQRNRPAGWHRVQR